MRQIANLVLCIVVSYGGDVIAAPPYVTSTSQCDTTSTVDEEHVVSSLCLKGEVYRLNYENNLRHIVFAKKNRKFVLSRISPSYDPSLVGANAIIGFLPKSLQAYEKNNILIYVSAIRTNGGDGSGQCGAGSEIYLNFLDVGRVVPSTRSKILIGSCKNSIELKRQNIADGEFGKISLQGERISLHFLNYKKLDGSPVAFIAPDMNSLIFP